MSPFQKRALASVGLAAGILVTAMAAADGTPETNDKIEAFAAAPAAPASITSPSTTAPVAEPATPVAVPAETASASVPTPVESVDPEAAAAPEPEPAAEVPAPPAPTGGGSVEDAIATYFGDIYDSAIGVAQCESGLDPYATNGQFRGLFQIGAMHQGLAAELGYSWDQMYDPYVNSHVARALYNGSGWQPWSCRWAA